MTVASLGFAIVHCLHVPIVAYEGHTAAFQGQRCLSMGKSGLPITAALLGLHSTL
ncbi:hypothetical protein E2C01_077087 [Portunus trituberculatus]|uniref:Uncharacterized protein n=1 Tax=Portunus trituberculatus TaxID=210409 RepID=A0A5B7IKG9_PORTR|nr:hypothetical protein [Portunus trituberculatus]